jgi:hypothetical protein
MSRVHDLILLHEDLARSHVEKTKVVRLPLRGTTSGLAASWSLCRGVPGWQVELVLKEQRVDECASVNTMLMKKRRIAEFIPETQHPLLGAFVTTLYDMGRIRTLSFHSLLSPASPALSLSLGRSTLPAWSP